jgi:hypothetical protein
MLARGPEQPLMTGAIVGEAISSGGERSPHVALGGKRSQPASEVGGRDSEAIASHGGGGRSRQVAAGLGGKRSQEGSDRRWREEIASGGERSQV